MYFNINLKAIATTILASSVLKLSAKKCNDFLTADKLTKAIDSCGIEKEVAKGENISCSAAFPYVKNALAHYDLKTPQQAAFYISVMNVESGGLTFNRNHFPGRKGQGTRSMMMPDNLYKFVKNSPTLQNAEPELKTLMQKPYDANDDVAKEALLKVLMPNKYSFLPGAWWIAKGSGIITPECANFAELLNSDKTATDENVSHLLKVCVVVDDIPGRLKLYKSTLNILKS